MFCQLKAFDVISLKTISKKLQSFTLFWAEEIKDMLLEDLRYYLCAMFIFSDSTYMFSIGSVSCISFIFWLDNTRHALKGCNLDCASCQYHSDNNRYFDGRFSECRNYSFCISCVLFSFATYIVSNYTKDKDIVNQVCI